jgi:hypothetical protein
MDGHTVVVCPFRGIVDKLVDGRAHLVVVCACAFVCRDIVFVPIYEAAKSAAFVFVRFAFALIVFFLCLCSFPWLSFALSGLPEVVSIASARFDVCR